MKYNSRSHSIWFNMNVGGLHWVHNDLTDTNLKAVHSCPVCQAFRHSTVWRHSAADAAALAAISGAAAVPPPLAMAA